MTLSFPTRLALLAGGIAATASLAACGTNAATAPPATDAAPGSSSSMTTMPMPAMTTAAPAAVPVAADHVVIQSFAFGPSSVMVKAGTPVSWTQQDEDQHTVTADDASFSSSPLTTGQTYTHTFTTPRTYHYHCSIHPFMHGTVVVTNG